MRKIYTKNDSLLKKRILKRAGLLFFIGGLAALFYFSFPLLSFHMYLQPAFASQGVTSPIPKATVLNESSIKSLIAQATQSLSGVDYTNAQNWFPSFQQAKATPAVAEYFLNIPSLSIEKAIVSTTNNNLSANLVHYGGTSVPPNKGNAVIFGHSTLPQLYKVNDYRTIFANLHTLKTHDTLELVIKDVVYTYEIFEISITDPTDTSFFAQNFDNNYLTLVTCTPPGTTWKRLILKARLKNE